MTRYLLEGVRVIDLTRVWSGPLATRTLADLGAEVIKVEAPNARPSPAPLSSQHSSAQPTTPVRMQGTFNKLNRNKLSVVLDLKRPEGVEVFLRLVSVSDVVIENYSASVMGNLGLDYERLCEVNPAIIMVSMPGFGTPGPYANYPALGPAIEPMTGITSLMGYQGGPPYVTSVGYPDPIGGIQAVVSVMTALWNRSRTGKGMRVDLSQVEATTALLGEFFVAFQLTGRLPQRMGNRHPYFAPQGCYPCRGDDKWVTLTVRSDAEWKGLCQAMGRPELASDPRLQSAEGRQRHHDEIDSIIAGWTGNLMHTEAMQILQEHGVPSGAVLNAPELLADPNLNSRGFFLPITEHEAGTFPYPGLPITVDGSRPDRRQPAPLFGQHNHHVLCGLLGLSETELSDLESRGVIGG